MDIDEACRQKAVETSDTLTSTPTKVYNIHAYVVLSGETKIHTKSTQIPGFHNTVSLILLKFCLAWDLGRMGVKSLEKDLKDSKTEGFKTASRRT